MKSYKLERENFLQYVETPSKTVSAGKVIVRITKAGITATDVAIFKGYRSVELPVVLSSLAVGVVSEAGDGVYSCEKGDRVLVVPYKECGRCFECKTGEESKCQNVSMSGVSADGFLCDFIEVSENKLIVLPKRIEDYQALFVRYIDIALQFCDVLDVSKGENVVIGNAGVLGIIIAQIVKHYQATPILIDANIKNIELAESFGLGYVYSSQKEDLVSSVMQATGGKMADSLILFSEHSFEAEKSPDFVKKGGKMAIYRENIGSANICIDKLFERNITLFPVKSLGKEYMSAINFLINQNVVVDGLYKEMGTFSTMEKTFENLSNIFEAKESIMINIVDMLV